jgi:outer membrane protein assembly factor BamA
MTGDLIYSEKKQIIAEFDGDFYFTSGAYRLLTNTWYKKFPNDFYGIGNNTLPSDRESYTSESFYTKLVLYRNVYSRINIAGQIRFESASIIETEAAGKLASGVIVGSSGGLVSGGGFVVNWDSRDKTFAAHSGSFYQVGTVFNGRLFGSDFTYTDIQIDLRNFFEVMPAHILAFQTGCEIANGAVPFRNSSTYGGQNFIRGYFEGQYRDNSGIGEQIEYRFPLWWRFGAVAFAGTAQVADRPSLWRLDEFKFAAGAGLRFFLNPEERVALRIDWGFGEGSSGMYITATEAF